MDIERLRGMSEDTSISDLFREIDAERQRKGFKPLSEIFLEWAEARGYVTVKNGEAKLIESETFVLMEWFDYLTKLAGIQQGALGIKIYLKTKRR